MLAFSEKYQKVVPFRVDRICRPTQLSEDRIPEPDGFEVSDYASKILIYMMDRSRKQVKKISLFK